MSSRASLRNGVGRLVKCAIRALFTGASALTGRGRLLYALDFVTRHVDSVVVNDGIRFDGRNALPLRRAQSLLTKEPDTIRWINDFVEPGDVFYDVGANVGVFSLYAALKRRARVLAFEPMCSNYDILNHNIMLNDASSSITAYNLAFHDQTCLSQLHLSAFMPGKSGHGFDIPISGHAETFEAVFRQGMIGMAMDEFIGQFDPPFPNHIKVDVDGNEVFIVRGMARVLTDPRLKTIAIELDPEGSPRDREAFEAIHGAGFALLSDEAYIDRQYSYYTNVRNRFFVRPTVQRQHVTRAGTLADVARIS